MKFTLLLTSLLMCQLTFAQTMREKKIKQEMLDRVDTMVDKLELARQDLEDEDVMAACKRIKELFVLYPEHLKAIGSHMDLSRSRTVKAKDAALNELIYVHRQTLICDRGTDGEYVDPRLMRKELRVLIKSLEKQKKIIRKADTDQENYFYYQYEF